MTRHKDSQRRQQEITPSVSDAVAKTGEQNGTKSHRIERIWKAFINMVQFETKKPLA